MKGKLGRLSNPDIGLHDKARLVKALMNARRGVMVAKKAGNREAELDAHKQVDEAKRSLGERGPVWWDDGAPDLNRHFVKSTPYAEGHSKAKLK